MSHNTRRVGDTMEPNVRPLTLELALMRWSVVCRRWNDIAGGSEPYLQAFLAGWCCKCIGASMPSNVGQMRESFRAGWSEAESQIEITFRPNTAVCGPKPSAGLGTQDRLVGTWNETKHEGE